MVGNAQSVDEVRPALEIIDLNLHYGVVAALKNISLRIDEGEFVALLGPSGCGKTSLLRAIAGFARPQSGSLLLRGVDVARTPPRERNIGLVFQSYALFPHMTALKNVAYGLRCRKVESDEAIRRARAGLDLVGLSDLCDRYPAELSGGQQQRVALARAIVIKPNLLLLDEPLGALDKQLRTQMQTEIKKLQTHVGITTVMVTHDQEEAMSMADRIVVMKDGLVQQVDTPEKLFNAPRSAWIADFVAAGSLLRGDFAKADDGNLKLVLSADSHIDVQPDPAGSGDRGVVFVPAGKLKVSPSNSDRGLQIAGRRFLGVDVELQIAYPQGTITLQLPAAEGAGMEIGDYVSVTSSSADARILPTI